MNSLKVFALFLSLASVTAAQKEVPLPKDLPPYAAEQPLRAPAVQSSKLANGLTVWLVSQRGLPKVAFAVAVRGGFAADPADRPGITELLTKTSIKEPSRAPPNRFPRNFRQLAATSAPNPAKTLCRSQPPFSPPKCMQA